MLSTVAHHVSLVKGFFRFMATTGRCRDDGAADFAVRAKPRRLPRAFSSHEEARRLIETTPAGGAIPMRDRAILELAYGSGLRSAEILGLRLAQLMLRERQLLIIGMGNKERIVFFGKTAAIALGSYLRDERLELASGNPRRTDLVFPNSRGHGLARMALYNIVRDRAAAAEIRGLTPQHHDDYDLPAPGHEASARGNSEVSSTRVEGSHATRRWSAHSTFVPRHET